MNAVDAIVGFAAEMGDRTSRLGARAREACQLDGPLSAPMADWAIGVTCARYQRESVAALAERGDLADQRAAVSLARSVATAPLRAIARPLLRGARSVRVRAREGGDRFGSLVVEELRTRGLSVSITAEPARDWLARQLADGVTHLEAYGDDTTVAAIRDALPAGVAFEGRGHGFGLAIVQLASVARREPGPADWDAIALDVAAYDQFGCLSPRGVYLVDEVFASSVGDDTLARCVRALGEALERAGQKWPRAPLDVGTAATVHQWMGAQAASNDVFERSANGSVAASRRFVSAHSPGARNVVVGCVQTIGELAARLAPQARHLTCLGVSGELATVRDALAKSASDAWTRDFRGRIVAAGTMQDPPLDGPEDPRPPIGA